jgi:non-heme chloroperoxidase
MMNFTTTFNFIFVTVALLAVVLAVAIYSGGPSAPKPMASINNPFKAVDFSDLPPLLYYKAEDGVALAYRHYMSVVVNPKGSVVLVHGSSASSNSMHILAKTLASSGYESYSLDIRGHGKSGVKGTIKYIGQLEDDLASFLKNTALAKPATLAGFSSGGGFVLRFAGSKRQDEFQSYLLLSPFLGSNAINYQANSSGWVNVGIPRVIGISLLNYFGIRAFNDLPVTSFALSEEAKVFLTPTYSFSMAENFQPLRDYESNIRAVHKPVTVVAGASDEIFATEKLEGIFRKQDKFWPVILLPRIGHIALTLDPSAVSAIVQALNAMPRIEPSLK